MTSTKRNRELRRKKQLIALEHLGGQCTSCSLKATVDNYTVFDFHHTNKDDKLFTVSQLFNRSRPLDIIMEEVNKCVLLCANCHRLHHQINGY